MCKAWTAIDRLMTIWKSDLTDKIKHEFFQPIAMSIQLCDCTTSTKKHLKKKEKKKELDGNYTRMLHAVLNKP